MSDRLTAAGFRAWLEDRAATQPRRPVGTQGSLVACPLATYLATSLGPRAQVHCRSVWDPDAGFRPLPGWARRFVRLVDARPPLGQPGGPPGRRVSPRLALQLLDEALVATSRTSRASTGGAAAG